MSKVFTTLIVPFDARHLIDQHNNQDKEAPIDEIIETLWRRWSTRSTLGQVLDHQDHPREPSHQGFAFSQEKLSPLIEHLSIDNQTHPQRAERQALISEGLQKLCHEEEVKQSQVRYNSELLVRLSQTQSTRLFPALFEGSGACSDQAQRLREQLEAEIDREFGSKELADYDPPKSLARLWRLDPPQLGHISRPTTQDVLRGQMLAFAADTQAFTQWGLSQLQLRRNQSIDSNQVITPPSEKVTLELTRALITLSPWLYGEISLTFSWETSQHLSEKQRSSAMTEEEREQLYLDALLEDFDQINQVIYQLTRTSGTLSKEAKRGQAEYVFTAHPQWINEDVKPEDKKLITARSLYEERAKKAKLPQIFGSKDGFSLWALCQYFFALSDEAALDITGNEDHPIIRHRKAFHLTSIIPFPHLEWPSSILSHPQIEQKLINIARGTRSLKFDEKIEKAQWFARLNVCLTRNGVAALQTNGVADGNVYVFVQRSYLLLTLHTIAHRAALRRAIDEAHAKVWHLKSRGDNTRFSDIDDVSERDVSEVTHLIEELIALRLCFSTAGAGSREHSRWLNWLEEQFDIEALRKDAEDTTRDLSALIDGYLQRRDLQAERVISRVALIITPFALLSGLLGMNNIKDQLFKGAEATTGIEHLISHLTFQSVLGMSILIGFGLLIRITPWEHEVGVSTDGKRVKLWRHPILMRVRALYTTSTQVTSRSRSFLTLRTLSGLVPVSALNDSSSPHQSKRHLKDKLHIPAYLILLLGINWPLISVGYEYFGGLSTLLITVIIASITYHSILLSGFICLSLYFAISVFWY